MMTALNMITVDFARELAPDNISCVAMSPGWVKTKMTSFTGPTETPEVGALMINVINGLKPNDTAIFFTETDSSFHSSLKFTFSLLMYTHAISAKHCPSMTSLFSQAWTAVSWRQLNERQGFAYKYSLSVQKGPEAVALRTKNRPL